MRYKFEFELVIPDAAWRDGADGASVEDLATQVSYLVTRYAEMLKLPGIKEIPTKPISHPDCERMVDVVVWEGRE